VIFGCDQANSLKGSATSLFAIMCYHLPPTSYGIIMQGLKNMFENASYHKLAILLLFMYFYYTMAGNFTIEI